MSLGKRFLGARASSPAYDREGRARTPAPPDPNPALGGEGYKIIPHAVGGGVIAELIQALEAAKNKAGNVHALRNLLQIPAIRTLAISPAIRRLVDPTLGPAAQPVRGIFFDKTAGANWKVNWHQDITIAVKRRIDVEGFGPWSVKTGVPHVQPPAAILADMLTIRLHLDDCDEDNGPLRVIPGSHSVGIMSGATISDFRQRVPCVQCPCAVGGVLVMRPLLLHASSQANVPRHRRVIHIEYASGALPGGLEWHERLTESDSGCNTVERGL